MTAEIALDVLAILGLVSPPVLTYLARELKNEKEKSKRLSSEQDETGAKLKKTEENLAKAERTLRWVTLRFGNSVFDATFLRQIARHMAGEEAVLESLVQSYENEKARAEALKAVGDDIDG